MKQRTSRTYQITPALYSRLVSKYHLSPVAATEIRISLCQGKPLSHYNIVEERLHDGNAAVIANNLKKPLYHCLGAVNVSDPGMFVQQQAMFAS